MTFTNSLAQTASDTRIELGVKRLVAVYPEPFSVIQDVTPMITLDASQLEVPLDPQSVTITLNGVNVTENSEITSAYIIYQPSEPLPDGKYEVRATSSDIDKKTVEPISWVFSISRTAEMAAGAHPESDDNTTGRFSITTHSVSASFDKQDAVDVTQLFREKEGTRTDADLSFTNVTDKRTISASYHRETQDYTGVSIDRARIGYSTDGLTATLGDSWFSISDLTILGTQMNGLSIEKDTGKWILVPFAGRTQDTSSGYLKQMSAGLKSTYKWNSGQLTTFTYVKADEKSAFPSETPRHDRIASLRHTLSISPKIKTSLETAVNEYRYSGTPGTANDSASRITLETTSRRFNTTSEYYNYGKEFMPVSDSSARLQRKNREGYKVRASIQPLKPITIGGEYEDYDTAPNSENIHPAGSLRTNIYANISAGILQSANIRQTTLNTGSATTTTDSDTLGVTNVISIPSFGPFAESRLVVGWQKIDYSLFNKLKLEQTDTSTTVQLLNINTAWRDMFTISAAYTDADTDITLPTALSHNRSTTTSGAVTWSIIPFKLLLTGRYEHVKNTGSTIDNLEDNFKTVLKYIVNDTYSLNLGYDTIHHSDAVNSVYNYTERIVRIGEEMTF